MANHSYAEYDRKHASDPDYTKWLRLRLQNTIEKLDSGEMKSYSSDTARAVVQARLKERRSVNLF
jgi:hypothetical protein